MCARFVAGIGLVLDARDAQPQTLQQIGHPRLRDLFSTHHFKRLGKESFPDILHVVMSCYFSNNSAFYLSEILFDCTEIDVLRSRCY